MAKKGRGLDRNAGRQTNKRVRSAQPEPRKTIPRVAIQRDAFPSWHFSSVDWDGEWGWGKLGLQDYRDLIEWMKTIECQNWGEVLQQSATRNAKHHTMPRGELCRGAQKRLEEICQDDTDEVFSFRLSGQKRLWGIVQNNIFKILWWDPLHTVYPVKKRNT